MTRVSGLPSITSKNLATEGNLDKPVILWSRSLDKAYVHSEAVEIDIVVSSLEAAINDSDMI